MYTPHTHSHTHTYTHTTLNRCNFALTLLSELVLDIQDGWTSHLPLLLHVMILGLDLNKPIVFEHSKRLLGNLLFVLICHNNAQAASQVRMMQQSLSCHSPLPLGYVEGEAGHMMEKAESQESLLSDSVRCAQEQVLSTEAKELVEFASSRLVGCVDGGREEGREKGWKERGRREGRRGRKSEGVEGGRKERGRREGGKGEGKE